MVMSPVLCCVSCCIEKTDVSDRQRITCPFRNGGPKLALYREWFGHGPASMYARALHTLDIALPKQEPSEHISMCRDETYETPNLTVMPRGC